ncbi:MAG TPA: hypothetical protein VGF28_04465 [Thermoanaerobaculia bacterium]|jgi:hypothetical protein
MPVTGRLSRIAFLLLTPVWIAGCAARGGTDTGPAPGIMRHSPCAANPKGETNRQAPIVCVDDSARTLTVSPEPVFVHDVLEGDRRSPVMLHWYTTSGTGDLRVEIEPGCVEAQRCDGNGHCSARTRPGSNKQQCKYDVWINGGKHDRLDPTIIISPCCT